MDFGEIENMGRKAPWLRSEIWDIHVDSSIKENTVECKPGCHVVIRVNSIDFALSLISRGRELLEKYSPRS